MASVNKVILIGNCGRDPEVRYLPSGKAVANVSIATTSRRKDQSGNVIEDTQWHRVQFFDKLAEIAGQYVKKGKSIYVEGRLKYGKYTDQNGVEKNTVDIVATELTLLGSANSEGSAGQPGYASNHTQQGAPARSPAPAQSPSPQPSAGFGDMDDDIPF